MRKSEIVYVIYRGIKRPGIIREIKADKLKIEVYYSTDFFGSDMIYFNWFDKNEVLHEV